MKLIARISILCFLPALLACAGCESCPIWTINPPPQRARAGDVYLVRGFLGIWSRGVDAIGKKVASDGVRSSLYRDDQWKDAAMDIIERYYDGPTREPIVIVGHSYGADDAINIARELDDAKVPVDLLITIDPVTPPKIPKNVRHACNIYQSNLLDTVPVFRGVAIEADGDFHGQLDNFDLHGNRPDLCDPGTDHFNIPKMPKLQAEVRRQILAVCVARDQWARAAATPHTAER